MEGSSGVDLRLGDLVWNRSFDPAGDPAPSLAFDLQPALQSAGVPAMKLATWNVNSIRAREERVLRWLGKHQPDVLCLQELKVTDDAFPLLPVQSLGYRAASRTEDLQRCRGPSKVSWLMSSAASTTGVTIQAWLKAARIERSRGDAYVPNGHEVGSDKWAYKVAWLRRLRAWLDRRFAKSDLVALGGDFNVATEARDVHDPASKPGVIFRRGRAAWGVRVGS
jgi:exodeoxyribonuclease-3